MSELERKFHEEWLGLVGQGDGLVVSIPVLVASQCMNRQSPEMQYRLRELCPPVELAVASRDRDSDDARAEVPAIADLADFLEAMLGLRPGDFDGRGALPDELSLYVPEGRQTLRPTAALRRLTQRSDEVPSVAVLGADVELPAGDGGAVEDAGASEAAKAGQRYLALVWDLAAEARPEVDGVASGEHAGFGVPLDKPERLTGDWNYAPAAKFERLLRHARVSIGILTNRTQVRLIYAPHGESTGSITFDIGHMSDTGGRPILDAFIMLLSSARWFSVAEEEQLPALLERSRQHQANVTNDLADQVFEALEILLQGFQSAAEHDGWEHLDDALARGSHDRDHLYGGLLTVLLRTVFLLYAEDRGLMPVEHPLYEAHYSVLGLFGQLQTDAGAHPDAMNRRYGAWSRMVSTWRSVYLGVRHGDFEMPPRYGQLFDPQVYPFLEGWDPAGSAPIKDADARAETRVPSVDDGTVYRMLERLLFLDRQRLSYRALQVEQIGSVYEALMGYHVVKLEHRAVGLRPNKAKRVWVSAVEVLAVAKAQREAWLKDEAGLTKSQAKKLAEALASAKGEDAGIEALAGTRGAGGRSAPAVAEPGTLVIQPGQERRRSSSHYTPRALTEPVVARTLEPLLAAMGSEPTAEQILDLKICDPAMGTGAFLVEVCRFLGEKVEAAWTRAGVLEEIGDRFGDPTMHARRLVAQRCVYGVDKNPFAVNLAKLSLWLETLAKNLPFTFLDHALKFGDSLVGLSFEQIEAFHWKPEEKSGQLELFARELAGARKEAVALRQKICDLAANEDPNDQREKARLLEDADDAMERVRFIGDLILGAFFACEKDKDREKERKRRQALVTEWLMLDGLSAEERRGQETRCAAVKAELVGMRAALLERQPTFHWMIEYPEIFVLDRRDPLAGGFETGAAYVDAFVGNPPFAGINAIAASCGPEMKAWLWEAFPGEKGTRGNVDYSAFFFLQAFHLLGCNGVLGFISTNTVSQGDTRKAGLKHICAANGTIYNARRNFPWPGEAGVTASSLSISKGIVGKYADIMIDGRASVAINSRLRPKPERPDPQALAENAALSFQGSVVLGSGFTLTSEQRHELVKKDRKNADRIFPYLGGEEVNSNPDQGFERYVINFGQMELQEAERWPNLITILREKVKPERDKLKDKSVDAQRKKYWWQYAGVSKNLYDTIRPLSRCLVTACVSKHVMFSFQPVDRVLSHKLFVFPLPASTSFAVLQSRIHELWAWLMCSTLETRINYSATECFANFPFPKPDPRTTIPELESLGEHLYTTRAQYMLDTEQGLTKTYNALKDPSCDDPRIVELRNLHVDLDRAVLRAYGWDVIAVPPYTTPQTRAEHSLFEAFEDEVIDRLFALNAERAGTAQLAPKEAADAAAPRRARKKKAGSE